MRASGCFSALNGSSSSFVRAALAHMRAHSAHLWHGGERSSHKPAISYFLLIGLRHVNGPGVSSIQRISEGPAVRCYMTPQLHDH